MQAEILYGIELLTMGKRRRELLAAVEAIFAKDFADRIFGLETDAARVFAKIAAARRSLVSRSSMRTRKLARSPRSEVRSLRRAILPISSIAVLI